MAAQNVQKGFREMVVMTALRTTTETIVVMLFLSSACLWSDALSMSITTL